MEDKRTTDNESRDLFSQFAKLHWMMLRYHHEKCGHHGPMSDPHRGQGRILTLLKMQPHITQKDLSYLLDMRPQSLGEFLTKLEKNGFITRAVSEADKRVMEIKLTEKGVAEADKKRNMNDVFDCLSDDEQEKFGEYLDKIRKSLAEKAGFDEEAHCEERLSRAHVMHMRGMRGYGMRGHGFGGCGMEEAERLRAMRGRYSSGNTGESDCEGRSEKDD